MRLITLLAMFAPFLLHAQALERHVVAAQGGFGSADDFSVSWTLGESFTAMNESPVLTITEGFQQPVIEISYQPDTPGSVARARLYPNPTSGHLVIDPADDRTSYRVEITDAKGSIIKTWNEQAGIINIDLEQYPPGNYFARLSYPGTGEAHTFKLIKH